MQTLPLAERRYDLAFIVFFAINLGFITYIVDLEQLVIADPPAFHVSAWPPRALVDLVHWWGRNFDPSLMAREPWWRATIWLDVLGFGPFYAFAIWAFVKGRDVDARAGAGVGGDHVRQRHDHPLRGAARRARARRGRAW